MRDPVRTILEPKSSAPERQPARSVWPRLDPEMAGLVRAYVQEAGTTAAYLKARLAAERSALARRRRAEKRRAAIKRTLESHPATPLAAFAELHRVSVRTIRNDLLVIRRERNGEGRCPACGSPLPAQVAPNKLYTRKEGEGGNPSDEQTGQPAHLKKEGENHGK